MTIVKNVTGAPARGNDFFNRKREVRQMWRRLETDNVLLLAPRRVGKTSLLQHLVDHAEAEGYQAVYLTVSDQATELDFVRLLCKGLSQLKGGDGIFKKAWDRLRSALPDLSLGKVEAFGVALELGPQHERHWRLVADALLRALREAPGRAVIMIDELPRFVVALLHLDRERARRFLNWFREARIDREVSENLRWILCGSIGLDTIVERERMGDTINDLKVESLEAFERPDADALLEALAETHKIELDASVRAAILDRLQWLIPYHIHLIFNALRTRELERVTLADAEAAYADLLHPTHRIYFDWWVQRLHEELGPTDGGHALAVLAAIAADPGGARGDTLSALLVSRQVDDGARQRGLLRVLEGDGYLVRQDGRYLFRSPLLRDYWRAHVLP